jgi:hypothetical protein
MGAKPMKNWIQSAVTGLLMERPAQKLTLAEHITQLAETGEALAYHYSQCPDTEANRTQLAHVITIERWGQDRLRAFLGEPLPDNTSDAYRPAADMTWHDLQDEFTAVREATLALTQQIAGHETDDTKTVLHDQYGKLTVRGWVHYLNTHANLESKRIR